MPFWLSLLALGAFHGLNPAMGWLFAVALGLQEGRTVGVLRALPPIALGHAASVAAVIVVVSVARLAVPLREVRVIGGVALVLFGVYRIARRGAHPRWVGMRVGFRDLTLWSFLMSSAHGAGLMLVPVLLGASAGSLAHEHSAVAANASRASRVAGEGIAAVGVHTAAMLAVMGAVAVLVYRVVGLELLRRAWINIDLLWAITLVGAGLVTLVMAHA